MLLIPSHTHMPFASYDVDFTIVFRRTFRKIFRFSLLILYMFSMFLLSLYDAMRVIRSVVVNHYENVAADQSLPCVQWTVIVFVLFFHSLKVEWKTIGSTSRILADATKYTHTDDERIFEQIITRVFEFFKMIMSRNLGQTTFA